MRRTLAVLLLAGAVLASGCTLDDLLGLVPAPDGGGASGGIANVRIEFSVLGSVWRDFPDGTSTVPDWEIKGVFQSGASYTYDPHTHEFDATWDGGDYSDTLMAVSFNDAEDHIEDLYATQTRLTAFGGWTLWHELGALDIPLVREDAGFRYFRVENVAACDHLTDVGFRDQSNAPDVTAAYNLIEHYCDDASFLEIRVNK